MLKKFNEYLTEGNKYKIDIYFNEGSMQFDTIKDFSGTFEDAQELAKGHILKFVNSRGYHGKTLWAMFYDSVTDEEDFKYRIKYNGKEFFK